MTREEAVGATYIFTDTVHLPLSALTGPGDPGTDAGERAPANTTHGLAGLGTFPL